jgi:hypothetical protein
MSREFHALVVRFVHGTGLTQACCPCRPRHAADTRGEALQEPAHQAWEAMSDVFTEHLREAALVKPESPRSARSDHRRR